MDPPPRLAQPVNFLNDCIVSANMYMYMWMCMCMYVYFLYADWLGGWIGGYMLCGWCSLSINCIHGGWMVQHVAI